MRGGSQLGLLDFGGAETMAMLAGQHTELLDSGQYGEERLLHVSQVGGGKDIFFKETVSDM